MEICCSCGLLLLSSCFIIRATMGPACCFCEDRREMDGALTITQIELHIGGKRGATVVVVVAAVVLTADGNKEEKERKFSS